MEKETVLSRFHWTSGSLNDAVRRYLKDHGHHYYNTFNGDVIAFIGSASRKVYAKQSASGTNLFEICTKF